MGMDRDEVVKSVPCAWQYFWRRYGWPIEKALNSCKVVLLGSLAECSPGGKNYKSIAPMRARYEAPFFPYDWAMTPMFRRHQHCVVDGTQHQAKALVVLERLRNMNLV